jgi:spermidine synthase
MLIKSEHRIKFSIFLLGFTSIITQIILLREFLSVLNGNELVTGMILANWMLLTGLGSYLGKFFKNQIEKTELINPGHLLIGLFPFIISFLIYYLRNIIYPPGKIINMADVFFSSFILLSPFCLTAGMLFPVLASHLSSMLKSNVINKVYSLEALGGIIGGILFNFILLFILKTFFSLAILMMINFIAAIANYFLSGKKILSYALSGLMIILTVIIIFTDLDKKTLQYIYPGQEIVYFKDTPYSKIVVTRLENQYNFYENGSFLFSSDNIIANEENVHYAMPQHPAPENILIISGGISGMIGEIMKYNITTIDYIEQNPDLINVAELFTSNIPAAPNLTIINKDARLFLKKNTDKKYDVVLINLPDPSSAQINRYYTLEFFEELKHNLNEFAIISISLSSTSNYMGEQARKINSSVFSTLKLLFQNVIIIHGNRNYFIASNGQLSRSIIELLESKKIENEYVNNNYMNDERITHESKLFEDVISENVAINYDFKPVAYLYQLNYWLSFFNFNYLILLLIILVPIIFAVIKLNFINFGVFVTGFTATSVEVLLILAFQVIYGYTYQMMGIIITFFMAGLLVGSFFLIDKIKIAISTYSMIQYIVGIFAVLIAIVLFILRSSLFGDILVHFIFIILIFTCGILTGIQFSLASKLRILSIQNLAASTYASDLLGAAVGAILVAVFLIPYFGIIKVSLILAILNFITGLYILIRAKNS